MSRQRKNNGYTPTPDGLPEGSVRSARSSGSSWPRRLRRWPLARYSCQCLLCIYADCATREASAAPIDGRNPRKRSALPRTKTLESAIAPAAKIGDKRTSQAGNSTPAATRSEEHTSELQSLIRLSYAVLCLKKKKKLSNTTLTIPQTIMT